MATSSSNQHLIKSYTDRTYTHTTMVRHKGTLIGFAMDDRRRIYYAVLDLDPSEKNKDQGPLDVKYWPEAPVALSFADEIEQVGYGLVGATRMPDVAEETGEEEDQPGTLGDDDKDTFLSSTARLTADAPFQVLSDGQFIYVFRQSIARDHTDVVHKLKNRGASADTTRPATDFTQDSAGNKVPVVDNTLLVDRFVLSSATLQRKMEVRYKRSRNRTQPASNKDSLGAKDMEGNFFFEPTQELDFIRNLQSGRFHALLLPTQVADVQRWQLFAHNNATGRIDSFNVERGADGLFNTKGTRFYTSPDSKYKDAVFERQAGRCPFTDQALIPIVSKEGYAESTLEFDGTDDYVSVSQLAAPAQGSIEAWIYADYDSSPSGYVTIIEFGTDSPHFGLSGGKVGLYSGARAVNELALRRWVHVAAVWNGSASHIYVDGTLAHTGASISPSGSGMGIAHHDGDSYFNGRIDEVRVWNRARGADDIKNDMSHRLVGNEPGLVGYWRFDEGSGDTLHDQTDNANHGTIHGATWVPSEAPIGQHPGMRRSSFALAGRTVESGMSALLYYQQENAQAGYDDEAKPMKQNARVMLSVATGGADTDGSDTDRNYIAALDFAVSREGKLAQAPDTIDLPALTEGSDANTILDEIAQLEAAISSTREEIRQVDQNIPTLEAGDRTSTEFRELVSQTSDNELFGDRVRLDTTTYFWDSNPVANYSPFATSLRVGMNEYPRPGEKIFDARSEYESLLPATTEVEIVEIATSLKSYYQKMTYVEDYEGPSGDYMYKGSGSVLESYYDRVIWHDGAASQEGYIMSGGDYGNCYDLASPLRQKRQRLQEELATKEARLQSLQGATVGQSIPMPLYHTDPHGLTVSGGLLGFAYSDDTPQLFDSAMGSLALYFRGAKEKFFAAYYDTKTARVRQRLTVGAGTVTFLARTAGSEMDQATIVVSGSATDTCTVTITRPAGDMTETWSQVPRDPRRLAAVLNGQAAERVYVGKAQATAGEVTSLTLAAGINQALLSGALLQIGDAKRATSAAVGHAATSIPLASAITIAADTEVYLRPYDYANATINKPGYSLQRGSLLFVVDPGQATSPVQNGTATGGGSTPSCQWVADAPGHAYRFDGVDDVMTSAEADTVAGTAAPSDLTLEAWVKPKNVDTRARVIHHHSASSKYTLGLQVQGSALSVDGSNDYVEVSQISAPSQGSIEAWIYADYDSAPSDYRTIVEFGNDSPHFGLAGGKLKIHPGAAASKALSLRRWVHVAGVWDGSASHVYVDGVLAGSGAAITPSGSGMGIGWHEGDNFFKGRIDEVRLWNRVRDADDIQTDMNRRLSGNQPGLVGYWYFEGTAATDHSGHGHHGTVHGSPQVAASALDACSVFVGIDERFVRSSKALVCNDWAHLAASFNQSYALQFDGNDHLECDHDTTLNLQDLTLEAVVKLDAVAGAVKPAAVADAGLLAKGDLRGGKPGQNVPYALSVKNGQIHFAFEDENARLVEVRSAMSSPLGAGIVYEIAVTRENITATSADGHADGSSMLGTNTPNFDSISDESDLANNDAKIEKSMKADYVAGKQRKNQLQPSASGSFQFASGSMVTQSTEIKMYVDGKLVYSQGISPVKPGRNNERLTIGLVGTRTCSGVISEVRLWSKARGPGEVGKTVTGSEEGLFSWWRLEEGEGNIAYDAKGGQHALVKGAQWAENPVPEASPLVLYCNGSAVDTEAVPASDALRTAKWGSHQFTLGARKDTQYYDKLAGDLEEVRVWKAARTQEQILDNLFTRLRGEKQDLLANYTFDEEDAAELKDHSLLRNHLPFGQAAKKPGRVLSTAPISNDVAQVRSALAGVKTAFHEVIGSSPAVAEYGDTQRDGEGNLIGVMKRCYGYVQNGAWQLITGYKVGNLVTEWIGQAQFDPQIMGFIEGAPPVPSENLTPGPVTLFSNYVNASSVEFVEADDVIHTYSSSQESGYDSSFEVAGSVGGKLDLRALLAPLGFGVSKKIDVTVGASMGAAFESSGSWSDGQTVSSGQNVTRAMKASLGGNWEDPDNLLNPNLGRRFVTTNMGFALVESKTADIFALRLAHNHALVSFRFEPNPDIPPDWNIIPFPLNPRYTKQGTLDGKVGFKDDGSVLCDPSYPMAAQYGEYSFFKPREAYLLKKRIDQEREKLRNYYENYDAAPLSRTAAAALGGVSGGLMAANAAIPGLGLAAGAVATFGSAIAASVTDQSVPDLASSRNIANTYVWTADGGFYAETNSTTNVKQESSSGEYSFSGKASAGFSLKVEAGATFGLEMESAIGGHMNLTKSKSAEATNTFSIHVKADPPGILQRYDENLKPQYEGGKPVNVPGKVDAYRFMTFYLESAKENHDDLFAKVVDPIWLKQSDHPNAVAMRMAKNSKKSPACWRIFHRVTFVSRLLPDFPDGTEPQLAKTMKAQNIESNWQLIQKLAPFVRNKTDNYAQFADATHNALTTYLPEMLAHEQEILKYLALYFDVDDSV